MVSHLALYSGAVNLGVVRHVGRLLDCQHGLFVPFELVNDRDLLLLLRRMLHLRGAGHGSDY